ncbi:hypothetical protein PsorP6_007737 [Peronosclerospora sorghi]|uniref:Uncharacterized protein n=1 Tax=Peronosclerospora sorghi TaxID=230839 RepID=A0ACC0WB77_9STRA|nr:hypothetical protein PsorP6_007737 [Peronosclerospora sorghi]
MNVLNHPAFIKGFLDPSFIAENPELLLPSKSTNCGQKMLKYIGNTIVKSPEKALGATGPAPSKVDPLIPTLSPPSASNENSLRKTYVDEGHEAFAKSVRAKKGLLRMDTTWRDAHQSLLATRLRTRDMLAMLLLLPSPCGIYVLSIKDMAGLLKPTAAKILVSAIRKEFPDLLIHVHTHDTAGTGVSSMLEAAYARADAMDVATDAMSGTTSQPSMGAIVAALKGSNYDTNVDPDEIM